MSCRRAFDVDLADFVASSARPEWAEFRAHYARCAECSAEVRAWTELHLLLQPPAAHPAEELLFRFETERDRLPAAERRAVEANLARSENDVLTRARKEAAAPALGGRLGTGAAGGAEPAPKAELADEKASVDSEAAVERAPRDVATRAATPEPAGWKALALSGPGAPVDVAARDLGTGLVLTLTVPGATRAGDVEVRVLDARGGREMRERFARAAERVAMHLPAAWLTPGTYTAELRRLDAGPSSAEVFSFRVVP